MSYSSYIYNTKPVHWNYIDFALHLIQETNILSYEQLLTKIRFDLKAIIDSELYSEKAKDYTKKLLKNWKTSLPNIKETYERYHNQRKSSPSSSSSATINVNNSVIQSQPINSKNTTIFNSNTSSSTTSDKEKDIFFSNADETISITGQKRKYEYFQPCATSNSPNKPRLEKTDFIDLAPLFEICISTNNNTCNNPSSILYHDYQTNLKDQRQNICLKKYPNALDFLKTAIDQPYEEFIEYVWKHKVNDDPIRKEEADIIQMMKYILTDFSLNCRKKVKFNSFNERTPFIENFIPIFKAFGTITELLTFAWCEKGLMTNRLLTLCLPENTSNLNTLLDGIGMTTKELKEVVLIESSGIKDNNHNEGDTLKQLQNTMACLKMEMLKYKYASFNTMKKRSIFGIHFIENKMTLTSTAIINKYKWSFLEIRSAIIPRQWNDRKQFMKVFEFLLKLKDLLKEQEELCELLDDEHTGIVEVNEVDTVNHVIHQTDDFSKQSLDGLNMDK